MPIFDESWEENGMHKLIKNIIIDKKLTSMFLLKITLRNLTNSNSIS